MISYQLDSGKYNNLFAIKNVFLMQSLFSFCFFMQEDSDYQMNKIWGLKLCDSTET